MKANFRIPNETKAITAHGLQVEQVFIRRGTLHEWYVNMASYATDKLMQSLHLVVLKKTTISQEKSHFFFETKGFFSQVASKRRELTDTNLVAPVSVLYFLKLVNLILGGVVSHYVCMIEKMLNKIRKQFFRKTSNIKTEL